MVIKHAASFPYHTHQQVVFPSNINLFFVLRNLVSAYYLKNGFK